MDKRQDLYGVVFLVALAAFVVWISHWPLWPNQYPGIGYIVCSIGIAIGMKLIMLFYPHRRWLGAIGFLLLFTFSLILISIVAIHEPAAESASPFIP